MSRQLDNWSVYFDNERQPLLGRLTFFKLHTTEKITITTESGIALDNPIHTTENGKTTHQVFLPDEDVTVLVEKYIGGGNMSDDENNLSAWVEQYTFDSLKNTVMINVGDGVVSASYAATMTALRQLDITATNYALLYGYYEMGDMPIAKYMLDLDSTSADNGGSIIRIDSQHVWRLVPDRVIDCRIFGVFPAEDDQTIRAYNSQLRLCFSYANSLGLDVYIPQVYPNAGYYYIEGAAHTLGQKLYIDAGVKIIAKPGTSSTLTVDEIEYFGNNLFRSTGTYGSLRVNCPTVKTSWKSSSWAVWPGTVKKFIVDSLNTSFTMRDAIVEFTHDISGHDITMERCLITSDNHIRNCTLTLNNCDRVSDFWVYTGVTLHLSGNIIELANFSSASTYIQWKNIQGESNYGDLGEQTVTGVTLLNNAIAENAQFVNVSVQGNVELHNVSGNIIPTGSPGSLNINAVDCWMALTGNNLVLASLQLRRGNITGNTVQVLSTLYLDNVDLNITTLNIPGAASTIMNSRINGAVNGTAINLLNNQIYANVSQTDNNGVISVNCIGNMFHNSARHNIYANTANSVVNGIWSHNGSSYDNMHWIRLDRTNLKVYDYDHRYSYVGNAEPYLSKYSGGNYRMNFAGYRGNKESGRGIFATTTTPILFWNTYTNEISVVNRSVSWKMFTVGRTNTRRIARIGSNLTAVGYSEAADSNRTHATIVWTWTPAQYGILMASCLDGTGEALYDWSFENPQTDHTQSQFSNGTVIGIWARDPTGSANAWFAEYPANPINVSKLEIYIDPDYESSGQAVVDVGYLT